MGVRNLTEQIVTMAELIASKRFDSEQDVYKTPDSVLPRIRRNGKIVRPLRFYVSDVERLFSLPEVEKLSIEREPTSFIKPSINFKKRRR